MKKEKKWTPHIIAAAALVVFIVLGLACASMLPQSGPVMLKTYEMQIMPNAGTLQSKGAVVFDMVMAEKVMPKNAVGGSTALGRVADLRSFTNGATNATWIEQENDAVAKKQPVLYSAFSARYTELNSADTVRSTFNLNGVTPTVDYFSKANADIRARIAAACAENKTDFAVTMAGQIVYAQTMNSAPISVPTTVVVEVCLFDKTGALVSQGKVETVSYLTRGTGHINVLNLLLDDAIEDIVLMLPALGGNGEKSGTKEYVQPSLDTDRGDTREAGPNETVLIVQRTDSVAGWPCTLIINKGTDNERSIPINARTEIRLIIQNGENVMEAQVPVTGSREKNDPVTFTAAGGQITYTLSVKGTVGAGNLGVNERFTWTRQ